jgi:acyl-CoA synthetase (AMP-forming)/AMP-acid ligase II
MLDVVKGADGDAAIGAPGRAPLTYAALRHLIGNTVVGLNALGIGRNDRVAIVLSNGPEMAAAFVTIAAGATTAPLNPAYRAEEFEFYLSDLGAKALVLDAAGHEAAEATAKKLGVPMLRLEVPADAPAGKFKLVGKPIGPARVTGAAEPGDIALVLHTSGTTSRPKIVPLSGANVAASAKHIRETLALTPADRCLNIMPLFHIHGLIAAVTASLSAGASVVATPGFNALKFFQWLDAAEPTWYTAVPTMHQAILARAPRNPESVAQSRLRFIRSSSSSLPPQVMAELEAAFRCPVIESYGMTEATHQMASNPLPPKPRKAGSVGPAAGPEMAIMAPDGSMLPASEVGEIVIRGPNVTAGYENNDKANAEAFAHGWFHTGDQGTMDAGGYVRITGRLKEITTAAARRFRRARSTRC